MYSLSAAIYKSILSFPLDIIHYILSRSQTLTCRSLFSGSTVTYGILASLAPPHLGENRRAGVFNSGNVHVYEATSLLLAGCETDCPRGRGRLGLHAHALTS